MSWGYRGSGGDGVEMLRKGEWDGDIEEVGVQRRWGR